MRYHVAFVFYSINSTTRVVFLSTIYVRNIQYIHLYEYIDIGEY